MSWHIDQELMDRYQVGDVDRVLAASVEMHVTACVACRGLTVAQPDAVSASWDRVLDRVQSSEPNWLEQTLTTFAVPPTTARLVAVTPAMRFSWLVALALVLGFAAAMAHLMDPSTAAIAFGSVAPVLPVAGVALAYGRLADPSFEIVASTPVDRFRLLLLRVLAVTVTTLALSLLVGLALPDLGFFGFWVLPALALTAVVLVLSSRIEIWKAAAAVTVGWALLVAQAASSLSGREWLFGPDSQPVFGLLALIAAIGVVLLKDSFNRGGVR